MRRLHGLLLLLDTAAVAATDFSKDPRFTFAPTTTEEVPTFYHLTPYQDLLCNGTAFTEDADLGCHGWHGLSEHECKMKCASGEALDHCRNKLCFAVAYHSGGGGWCHIYDHANCLGMVPSSYVTTFKKEHGERQIGPAGEVNLGALALAAGAALVAAAEMSHRHAVSNATLAEDVIKSVEKVGGHVNGLRGAEAGAVVPSAKTAAAASSTEAGTSTSEPHTFSRGSTSLRTTTPAASLHFETSPKPVPTFKLPPSPDSTAPGGGAAAIFKPVFVVPFLLLACCLGYAIWQALGRRSARRSRDGDEEGEVPTRYPNDME